MKSILFDLDGTLTDPKVGITTCARYALEKMEIASPEDLDWIIGPPLQESFGVLLGESRKSDVQNAVDHFRVRFANVGMFENDVYPGIPEMLQAIVESGRKLFVATSKPRVFAEKIVRHFDLERYFEKVYGSELDGVRSDKAHLIRHILDEVSGKASDFTMIGDRKHDLIGARKNGMAGIGVLWGYGTRKELEECEPKVLVDSPFQLAKYFE
jgi:phosphoglycolate phosphatase